MTHVVSLGKLPCVLDRLYIAPTPGTRDQLMRTITTTPLYYTPLLLHHCSGTILHTTRPHNNHISCCITHLYKVALNERALPSHNMELQPIQLINHSYFQLLQFIDHLPFKFSESQKCQISVRYLSEFKEDRLLPIHLKQLHKRYYCQLKGKNIKYLPYFRN